MDTTLLVTGIISEDDYITPDWELNFCFVGYKWYFKKMCFPRTVYIVPRENYVNGRKSCIGLEKYMHLDRVAVLYIN